jgi:hypothetical protein
MSDQVELFDRSKELTCPFAKRDRAVGCALHSYLQLLSDVNTKLDYLNDKARDLVRLLYK